MNLLGHNIVEVDGPNSTTPLDGGFRSSTNSSLVSWTKDFEEETYGTRYYISQFGDSSGISSYSTC